MPKCKTPSCESRKFESKTFNQKYCLHTEECRQFAYNKAIEKVEQKREKDRKNEKKEWNKRKKQKEIELMSTNEYREKKIQPLINEIARIIDKDQPCIATNNLNGKRNAGHFHSIGSNLTLALNLHNIHIQSEHSNNWKGGDTIRYRHGLIRVYGERYADFVDMFLCQCPALHLTKQEMIDKRPEIMEIRTTLKKADKVYTTEERINLRTWVNNEIGFYPKQFSDFIVYRDTQ